MKKVLFYTILFVVNLAVLEVLLSLYFFHRRSEYPLAVAHYAAHQYAALARTFSPEVSPVGIWKDDPMFGYVHVPGSTGRHKAEEFDVVYSIDAEGRRVTSTAARGGMRIGFMGASFTFGFGVQDDETYPAILASNQWAAHRVENYAVSGWGTTHAYLMMKYLTDRNQAPDILIYGIIPDHISRNYLRASWLQSLSQSNRLHPHFEIHRDQLTFMGVVGIESAVDASPWLRRIELQMTAKLVADMQNLAQAHGIRLIVVLLPQKYAISGGGMDWPPALVIEFVRSGVELVDLSAAKERVEFFRQDVHPTAAGHRTLAEAIDGAVSLRDDALAGIVPHPTDDQRRAP